MKKCWHWPIFPVRRQTSIFGSARLDFCVRNGYRYTPCDKNTNFFQILDCTLSGLGWHWPIFPARRQASIFGSARLDFCVRNGNRYTPCDKNTNQLVHLRGLEPRTHWLRVSCSTNWARGAYCTRGAIRKCSLKTEQRYIWEAMKLRWMCITQQCIEIESNTK